MEDCLEEEKEEEEDTRIIRKVVTCSDDTVFICPRRLESSKG
jgi:hypothetical protein